MLAFLFLLMMPLIARCDVLLPELEFLVGQMSISECQHLADALRVDSGASNVEGVTCLDELIRLHYALKNEGPNIVRGVFKHKLNQIGRRDLAQWLSIEKDPNVLIRSKNGADEEQVPIEGKMGPLETLKRSPTSWCEIAVTIALLYTGALLVWLTIRVLICKMKKHFRDKGLASRGHGYSYYPAPQEWPSSPHWSPPSQQRSPPSQHWSPTGQQRSSTQQERVGHSDHHHHHHHNCPPSSTSYDQQ